MNNKKSDQRAGEKQKKKEIFFRTNFFLVGFNTKKTTLATKNRSKGREKME